MKSGGDESGRRKALLKGTFAALILLTLANVAVGFASLPEFYERVSTSSVGVVVGPDGEPLVSDALFSEAAAERGMSMPVYAGYSIVLMVGNTLVLGTLAAVVLWRARRDWFGWLTAFVILFLGSYTSSEAVWVAGLLPLWVLDLGLPLWAFYLLYFFLFPNGRAVPHSTKTIAGIFFAVLAFLPGLYLAGQVFTGLTPQGFEDALTVTTIAVTFLCFAFILVCQVYRYRHVSGLIERQQTKWFVVGMVLVLLTWPFAVAFEFPLETEFFLVTTAILPVNVAVAMLRYRLFDVDVLINRALVYLLLTAVLAGAYFGSVAALQYGLRSLTGEESQIAIVASTLVIAAMFVPLRRRVQGFIDRRFYRSKYDAARTMESFSKRLRDETDLETLTGDLVSVARETVQPSHASLWLRRNLDVREDGGEGRNG